MIHYRPLFHHTFTSNQVIDMIHYSPLFHHTSTSNQVSDMIQYGPLFYQTCLFTSYQMRYMFKVIPCFIIHKPEIRWVTWLNMVPNFIIHSPVIRLVTWSNMVTYFFTSDMIQYSPLFLYIFTSNRVSDMIEYGPLFLHTFTSNQMNDTLQNGPLYHYSLISNHVNVVFKYEASSTMRELTSARCSITYLYSLYVKPDIKTTSTWKRLHLRKSPRVFHFILHSSVITWVTRYISPCFFIF